MPAGATLVVGRVARLLTFERHVAAIVDLCAGREEDDMCAEFGRRVRDVDCRSAAFAPAENGERRQIELLKTSDAMAAGGERRALRRSPS